MTDDINKDRWDKFKILGGVVAAIGVPLTVAWIGNSYTEAIEKAAHANAQAIKDKETNAKFVELAIRILTADPTPETTGLRRWAVDVINRHSGVNLSLRTGDALVNKVPLTGKETRPIIDSVRTYASDELRIEGKHFGALAGDVFVSPKKSAIDKERYPLEILDWETTRIKVRREYSRNEEEGFIQKPGLFNFEVQTRGGWVSEPYNK